MVYGVLGSLVALGLSGFATLTIDKLGSSKRAPDGSKVINKVKPQSLGKSVRKVLRAKLNKRGDK
jgi:hypothetical protein